MGGTGSGRRGASAATHCACGAFIDRQRGGAGDLCAKCYQSKRRHAAGVKPRKPKELILEALAKEVAERAAARAERAAAVVAARAERPGPRPLSPERKAFRAEEVAKRRVARDSTRKFLERRTPELFARQQARKSLLSAQKPAQFILDEKGRTFHVRSMTAQPCGRCGAPPSFGPCPVCAPRASRRWAEVPTTAVPIIERRLHPVHYAGPFASARGRKPLTRVIRSSQEDRE